MTLGKTIAWSVGGMTGLALGIATRAFISVERLSGELSTAIESTGRKLVVVSDLKATVLAARTANRGVMLFSSINDKASVDKAKAAFRTAHSQLISQISEMRSLLTTNDGRQLLGDLENNLEQYTQHHKEVGDLCDQGRTAEAVTIDSGRGVTLGTGMSTAADELMKRQVRWNEEALARSATIRFRAKLGMFVLVLACLAMSGLTVLTLSRKVRRLRGHFDALRQSTEEVRSISARVSSSGQSLAQGASEQAASLEETSASTEEITAMTRRNAENSRTVADLMNQTSQGVGEANRSVDQMQVSTREINASSDKIGKIIKVIDEIAFQTNILALNAAVEAARAGEAGMGFAVVADEVRNLAQRSAQAARDTTDMIEESISKSKEGRNKLDQVSTVIRSITEGAQKVKILADEVKAGSEEQSCGIEQIARTIVQMQQVTQKSAAGAEETASAGHEMHEYANELSKVVEQLRSMIGDGSR
jgi:methyl-accepting chemotaxis protein/methyl-accepting chemotaxis protein-1 (serine sensor receptor)